MIKEVKERVSTYFKPRWCIKDFFENDNKNKYLQKEGKAMIKISEGKSNNLFQTSLMFWILLYHNIINLINIYPHI